MTPSRMPIAPAFINQGKTGARLCFTSDGWSDEMHFTIEHIAPQQATGGWEEGFYSEKEIVHKLGNLVLAPGAANTSLSSRPWTEKKVLYAALGATTADESKAILNGSGLTFAQSTEELAAMSRYMPHLRALGQRETSGIRPSWISALPFYFGSPICGSRTGSAWSCLTRSSDPVIRVNEEVDVNEDDLGDDEDSKRWRPNSLRPVSRTGRHATFEQQTDDSHVVSTITALDYAIRYRT